MRTVPFKQLLQEVAQMDDGTQPSELTASITATAVVMINAAMEMAWEYYDWPETLRTEARTPVDRLIAFEQPGKEVIHQPVDVWTADPAAANSRAKRLPWNQTDGGVLLACSTTADVWLQYQRVPPSFTAQIWAVDKTYVAGQLVYDDGDRVGATGECYRALAAVAPGVVPTDATKWQKQSVLWLLRQAVVQGAVAGMKSADSQYGSGRVKLENMTDLLDQKISNLTDLSQRVKTIRRR